MSKSNLDIEIVDLLDDGNPLELKSVPDKVLKCKYLMVGSRQRVFFIFGPVSNYRYHANLLNEFCRVRQIPSSWISKPDVVEVYDEEYQVLGGGYLDLNPSQKEIKVYGHSSAYGQPQPGILSQVISSPSFFSNYSIQF